MRRWWILAVAVAAQAAVTAMGYGLPFVLPDLRADEGLSLVGASTLATAPVLGMLVALIAWGAAADRWGERVVMTVGTVGAGLAGLAAALVPGVPAMAVFLVLAGVFSASITSASGRAVLGWFGARERGLAMGIRQTCTPLGLALAALVMPPVAAAHGFRTALGVVAAVCLVVAVAVPFVLVDPPRPRRTSERAPSPYRVARLWRIHSASALLVGPQFIASAFALTYLVDEQGWSAVAAGALIAVVQFAGAAGRIGAGVWSDRVASRMGPMRVIAVAAGLSLLVWAGGDLVAPWVAVVGLVAVMVISVTDNGLAFTATAELAGPTWAGRALGVQNTGQNLMALGIAPAFAAVVTEIGYPLALGLAAAMPALAVVLTPVRGETLEPITIQARA